MLHIVRSYFSQFYHKQRPASDVDINNEAIMLPRVYNYPNLQCNWDPIELKMREKCIEDIDNVIEKFVRVISVTEKNSTLRSTQYYVYKYTHNVFQTNFWIKLFERFL